MTEDAATSGATDRDARATALFDQHPLLLQIQYDPPEARESAASALLAWTSKVDGYDPNRPDLWDSDGWVVADEAEPHHDMADTPLRAELVAMRELCDGHHQDTGITSIVWHRNPNPPPVPEAAQPTKDEMNMRHARDMVSLGYWSAAEAMTKLALDISRLVELAALEQKARDEK